MVRTIWGDPERYTRTILEPRSGRYFTGDAARRDDDGYFWMLGRVDDVMNVSGHRLSTMEIESALVRHPAVAEAAVVGKPHEITGQAVCCFVTLKKGDWNHDDARRGAAQVGGTRDRDLRQARADPLHRRLAQDAQRQNHAAAAARDRDNPYGHRRRDDARGSFGRHQAGRAARRRIALRFNLFRRRKLASRIRVSSASPPAVEEAWLVRLDSLLVEDYLAQPAGRVSRGSAALREES